MEKCKFNKSCSNYNTIKCNNECFPYIVLHGTDGNGGYWASKRTPKKYDSCTIDNLPIQEENPKEYGILKKYCENVLDYTLNKNVGLFIFSVPNKDNTFGTGTGKTTAAITILNTFLIERIKDFIKDDFSFKVNPTIFVKLSELQNIYNSQFRGSFGDQETASKKFYILKNRLKKSELAVFDDIGTRDLTDAFKNELYEIIDHRATEEITTIYTSNYPLEKLNDFLGERIVSRIEGSTYKLGFKGKDHRKGGLF